MPKLRVMQVCSAREAVYGATVSLLTLADAQRIGMDSVRFMTFAGRKFGGQVRDHGYPVDEVRVRAKIDPIAIGRMTRLMRLHRPDIIHTHLSTSTVNGSLAARLARIPCVATVHGLSGKLSYVAATHLIAVSTQVKNHLVAQGIPADRVSVVYNGLRLRCEALCGDTARMNLGLDGAGPILGTVSRVTPAKGIDDALRVVAHLVPDFPRLQYVVVGDGDAMESCRSLAVTLGIADHVRFTGYQSDICPYLAAMDLFLFPSHQEAMGIALVEAMAAGLPTVATQNGGIPEVIVPDVGTLCPVRDVSAMAEACRRILQSRSTAVAMSAHARSRAAHVFSAQAMYEQTDTVYRQVLRMPLPISTDSVLPKSAQERLK